MKHAFIVVSDDEVLHGISFGKFEQVLVPLVGLLEQGVKILEDLHIDVVLHPFEKLGELNIFLKCS